MTAPAPADLAAALPQYEVGDSIGAGGMGVVYTAVHRPLGRRVAIKQLPGGRGQDPGMARRFDHEARLLASLDHPHIVPVYDYVQTDTVRLLVMEKLDGGTVWSRFHGEGLTGEQSCAIALAMLAGLHAAHQAGVLHLDVKPKNLLFTAVGVLKVADFGISQLVSEGATLVTRSGETLGTPAYIAPEQAMGNPLTPAADLYSAGTVLYELLSGTLPYETDGGALALLHQHVYADPRPIGEVAPGVTGGLAEVVMRCLVRDPRERYRDAEALAMDLAGAATQAYGVGWLDRAGLPVHLSPRVASHATRGPARASAPAGVVRASGGAASPDGSTALRPPLTLADFGTAAFVPARDMLRPPARDTLRRPVAGVARDPRASRGAPDEPWDAQVSRKGRAGSARWLLGAAGAAVVALAALLGMALAGAAGPARADVLGLTVNGTAAAGSPMLDLTATARLAGAAPEVGQLTAELRLSALGIGLGGQMTAEAQQGPDGRWQAAVEVPPLARWLAGGAVTGEVLLLRADGSMAGTQRFTVLPAQAPLLSAMGAGSVLLIMFTLAYLESIVRSVRRGRLRRSAPVLAAPVGAVFAAAAALLGSVLTRTEPSAGVLLAAAALGTFAASTLTLGLARPATM